MQALLRDGCIRLDGAAAKPSHTLRAGQRVQVVEPEPEPALPRPEAIPLRVVFEDPQLLVIDKPAGLVVHPGAGRSSAGRW